METTDVLIRAAEGAATALSTHRRVQNAFQNHRQRRQTANIYTMNSNQDGAMEDNSLYIFYMTWMPKIKRTLYLIFLGEMLFLGALCFYALLYVSIMPTKIFREKLYFDYSPSALSGVIGETLSRQQEEQTETSTGKISQFPPNILSQETYDSFSQTSCSNDSKSCNNISRHAHHPTALVDLLARYSQWYPYVSDVIPPSSPPYYLKNERLLQKNKQYFIDLVLELPESTSNVNVGIFMAQVDLYSDGTKLATSRRPTHLPYESLFAHYLKRISFLVLIPFIGILFVPGILFLPESKVVTVPCFHHFVESEHMPLEFVKVQLMNVNNNVILSPAHNYDTSFHSSSSQQHFSHYQSQIQVLSGEIHIGKELNSVQRIMKEWFYTCAFCCTFFFMIIETILFKMIAHKIDRFYKKRRALQSRQRTHRNRHRRNRNHNHQSHSSNDHQQQREQTNNNSNSNNYYTTGRSSMEEEDLDSDLWEEHGVEEEDANRNPSLSGLFSQSLNNPNRNQPKTYVRQSGSSAKKWEDSLLFLSEDEADIDLGEGYLYDDDEDDFWEETSHAKNDCSSTNKLDVENNISGQLKEPEKGNEEEIMKIVSPSTAQESHNNTPDDEDELDTKLSGIDTSLSQPSVVKDEQESDDIDLIEESNN